MIANCICQIAAQVNAVVTNSKKKYRKQEFSVSLTVKTEYVSKVYGEHLVPLFSDMTAHSFALDVMLQEHLVDWGDLIA